MKHPLRLQVQLPQVGLALSIRQNLVQLRVMRALGFLEELRQ
jgi:hypothetical protein